MFPPLPLLAARVQGLLRDFIPKGRQLDGRQPATGASNGGKRAFGARLRSTGQLPQAQLELNWLFGKSQFSKNDVSGGAAERAQSCEGRSDDRAKGSGDELSVR